MSSSIPVHRWLRVTLSWRSFQVRSIRLWSGQYGGRKWSSDPAGCGRLQGQLDLLAVMDAVVVENEMDPRSLPVRLRHEFVKEVQEQEAVLPVALRPM